jgi:hypothetical protein
MAETTWKAMTLAEGREALKFCNSYNRLPTLLDLQWSVSAADWLRLLGDEWSSCDNVGQCLDDLEESPLASLSPGDPDRRFLMNESELGVFDALPEEVTIWRGCYASNKWGLSWSLDRQAASRFPLLHRYKQERQPLLVKARIAKADVLMLKLDRNEAEVVWWWRRPKHIATTYLRRD